MTESRIKVELACPVERVWTVVTTLSCQDWRSDIERVEVTGKASFVEYAKSGIATNFIITRWEPPFHWAFDMNNENMSGHWTGEFRTVGQQKCEIVFTEMITAKKAWMRLFVGLYLKKQQKQYLSDLRKALGL